LARNTLRTAGFVLGIGFGGFFDGIVLHQLLQWHHLVSNVYPDNTVEGLEVNTLWDGIFHSAMYAVSVVGLVLLWRALSQRDTPFSPRTVIGAVLVGWGVFHLFDSVVNHWILQIHHIRMVDDWLVYDLAFFAIGVVMVGVGWGMSRQAAQTD
jgi:uncharacterized membrane protein